MTKSRGLFITLEGGEGAGKTTSVKYIQEKLQSHGIDLLLTREPGGTQSGEKIREILLNPDHSELHSDTELLLMFAARAQHLQEVIYPALQRGEWVLCDRFTDATYAYQGGGRGIDVARIQQLETWVQQGFQPDRTILFDLSVKEGLQRAASRGALDRFEQEKLQFFENVRAAYLARAEQFATRFRVIDSSVDIQGVETQLDSVIEELLREKNV